MIPIPRSFVGLFALIAGSLIPASSSAAEPQLTTNDQSLTTGAPRPNILFILVDDMGWKDLACYGSEFCTPSNPAGPAPR